MAVRNTLVDLNGYLFEQLERVNEAAPADIGQEVERARAMAGLADTIIQNANMVYKVAQYRDALAGGPARLPRMLGAGEAE